MKIHIETERLILREITNEDLDPMFELDSNPKVHEYLGKKPITTKAQAKTYINSIITQYKERGIGRFAVIEKSTGNFVGWSGLKFNTGDKETIGNKRDFYDIGYRLMPKYWGKGYASESAKVILDYGFKTLNLKTIVGAAETKNIASNKILEKIGLQFTETFFCDSVMVNWYELKKEDYAETMS
ncbi:GNAT family N-acetyltransferase [Ichthyenterobacterium magnum]|uniref:Ribosomal-protein-alanine N-acetyltransferase n=1 Tax=Ichthyenterobacterium magnum TaxID=1230530 RepID=A0A420DXQ0_9FLAO|nr:GNAT family N-acetyltransferase [Ichthyenterobacterium magnum]RKE98976.1 ribosomal-protein-alanine N-acetyltransferase [Ichthyenterobacterium magnum]